MSTVLASIRLQRFGGRTRSNREPRGNHAKDGARLFAANTSGPLFDSHRHTVERRSGIGAPPTDRVRPSSSDKFTSPAISSPATSRQCTGWVSPSVVSHWGRFPGCEGLSIPMLPIPTREPLRA